MTVASNATGTVEPPNTGVTSQEDAYSFCTHVPPPRR
jgi:hypothetical protein